MTPRPSPPRLSSLLSLASLSNLSRLFNRLRHYHIENKGLKLLALLIAFLLFAASRQPMSDVRLVGVPLEFRSLRDGLEISSDVSQTVSVRLHGPQDVIRNLMPNQLAVVANLDNKEPGERIVQLKTADVVRPENVEVTGIEPASIKLKIEPTRSRLLPIEPRFIGKLPSGFEIYRSIADPPTVKIVGPESRINQIERAPTESIQLDGHNATFTAVVDVDLPDHSLRVTTPGSIKLTIEIGPRRAETKTDEVKPKR